MNQFTKGVVIASTLLAAIVELYLATAPAYPSLLPIALAGFVFALLAGAWWPGPVSAVVLLLPYLARAVILYAFGSEFEPLEIIWALPLLGLVISGRTAWRWNVPMRFQWPLITWTLVIAVSWPIIVLRELDFTPAVLRMSNAAATSVGVTPWEAATGIGYWVLVHNLGLLWFDRLFGWYADGRWEPFRNRVVVPLLAAVAVACGVGIYQGFVDLYFLNPHLWPHMKRASGTLGDANAFGMVAALWLPAGVLAVRHLPRPWPLLLGTLGVMLTALGAFASGSRTALGALAIGLAALAFEGFRAWRRAGQSRLSAGRVALAVAGALVLAFVALTVTRRATITTVIDRGALELIPGVGDRSIADSLRETLWDRFGYGPAAVSMIMDHPWAGVGVGTFNTLVRDVAIARNGRPLAADNAQNWYRHLFAELGLLGSIPWMAWCAFFILLLLSPAPAGSDRFAVGVLRFTIIGFGVLSLLGVPGQSLPVALTFWTIVFWFMLLTTGAAAPATRSMAERHGAFWITMLVLVVAQGAMTLVDARGELRPRNRAIRFGWEYAQGIGDLERGTAFAPGRRWTEQQSITQIPVKGKVLKFVAWLDHPDADEHPVHVRVWADSRLVFEGDLKRPPSSIAIDIPAQPGASHLLLETQVSRTWAPRAYGQRDPRQLGLSIRDWAWE